MKLQVSITASITDQAMVKNGLIKGETVMKKMIKYIAVAFAAIVTVSCVNEMENGGSVQNARMVDVTFGVNIDDVDITKTSLGVENDHPAVLWTRGDKVAVWDGTQINEFTLVSGEGTSSAMFTGQVTEGAEKYCVIYPYESVLSYDKLDGAYQLFNLVTPVEQKVPVGGFAEGANVTVGYTNDLTQGVTLYNAGGYIRIEIVGSGMKSVTVFDNNNAVIAGTQTACIPINGDGYIRGRSDKLAANKVVLLPVDGKTGLDQGVYFLSLRGHKYTSGMTVKFENVDGTVAYYTSSTADNNSTANYTIDLGQADVSRINWKKTDVMELDFELQKWPFDVALSAKDKAAEIYGTFTLTSNGKGFNLKSVAHESESLISDRGVRMATQGDYIEFPAVPGKKLKEVRVYSTGKFTGCVSDAEGESHSGTAYYLRTGGTYTYLLPYSTLNTRYRLTVTGSSTRVTKLTLYYVGDDVAELSSVSATASNSFTGFTIKGEIAGSGLDAASWGVQYAVADGDWTDGPVGNGGKINELIEVPAGTYNVRVWASADGGTNKIYSDISIVEVKAFAGTITLDFINNVDENVEFVSTTDEDAGAPQALNKWRNMTGEDTYLFRTPEGEFLFTFYSHKESETADRIQMKYAINPNSLGLRVDSSGNTSKGFAYMSIPAITGWNLNKIEYHSTKDGAHSSIYDRPYYATGAEIAVYQQTLEEGIYKCLLDVSDKNLTAGKPYYFVFRRANYHIRDMVITYTKVN